MLIDPVANERARIVIGDQQTLFPYARWHASMAALAAEYSRRQPFPHVHLLDFFNAPVIAKLIEEFAQPHHGRWIQYKHYNENKVGRTDRSAFPPFIGRVIDELNSDAFVAWLSQLTGIPNLLADPSLEGGGMHQSGAGGFLNVHADFTMHHHHKNWRRRINVVVYLNQGWNPEWGGAIELWDKTMRRCVVRIPPLANHAVIFNTDEHSYHGFPDPMTCPAGTTRNSLALYYYTVDEDTQASRHRSTDYRARPGDGRAKAALIWTDKQLVHLYSKLKSTLGLSDDIASQALGLLARRKGRRH